MPRTLPRRLLAASCAHATSRLCRPSRPDNAVARASVAMLSPGAASARNASPALLFPRARLRRLWPERRHPKRRKGSRLKATRDETRPCRKRTPSHANGRRTRGGGATARELSARRRGVRLARCSRRGCAAAQVPSLRSLASDGRATTGREPAARRPRLHSPQTHATPRKGPAKPPPRWRAAEAKKEKTRRPFRPRRECARDASRGSRRWPADGRKNVRVYRWREDCQRTHRQVPQRRAADAKRRRNSRERGRGGRRRGGAPVGRSLGRPMR